MLSAKKGTSPVVLLCIVVLTLFLGACSARNQGDSASRSAMYREEGPPLTETELAALYTKGKIDRNMPNAEMEEVKGEYRHFLRKARPTMERFSQRAAQYLPWAQKVFRERGMPEELAYLAIVESGYRADITSKAGAAGAWQFMSFTGKKFDLSQDAWNDERLDPYEATEAAAKYLQKLYGDFKDWPTAIAAYNAGEGKIKRAKEGTGARNYYEIKQRNHKLSEKAQLREETKRYVPRFIAITKIMRNLEQLDFPPLQPELCPEILRYTVRPGTDLRGMARAVDMPWSEFAKYNRHHKKMSTSPTRETYVYVPASKQAMATAFLQSPLALAQNAGSQGKNRDAGKGNVSRPSKNTAFNARKRATYTVQDRDSLWIIARKHNVSVDDLKRWNNVDEKKLSVGKVLVVSEK